MNPTNCQCSVCTYVRTHTEEEQKEMAQVLKEEREQYPPFQEE